MVTLNHSHTVNRESDIVCLFCVHVLVDKADRKFKTTLIVNWNLQADLRATISFWNLLPVCKLTQDADPLRNPFFLSLKCSFSILQSDVGGPFFAYWGSYVSLLLLQNVLNLFNQLGIFQFNISALGFDLGELLYFQPAQILHL